jgi:hypothetical protein
MSSTAWLTRRSVLLGSSELSPARSHRSDEPATETSVRCTLLSSRSLARHSRRPRSDRSEDDHFFAS